MSKTIGSNHLSDFDKNVIAWKKAITLFGKYTLYSLLGLIACLLISQVVIFISEHVSVQTIGYIVTTLFVTSLLGYVLKSMKDKIYRDMFGEVDPIGSWYENNGNKPSHARVNVQRLSGKVEWNVSPDSLDWSTISEDPIACYMRKK